jgi:LysM repeat protein
MIQTLGTSGISKGSTIQHVVASGEWLTQIARCYGADLTELSIANPQVTDPGASLDSMILTIPRMGSVGPIYGPPCVIFHVVQSDETWHSIAQKYNADIAVLQLANGNTTFSIGTTIKVPLNSAGGPQVPRITSAEDKESLVEDILKKSYTGSITYTSPSSMTIGAQSPVELYLTPSLSAGEIVSLVEASGLTTSTPESDTVFTSGDEEVKITSTSKIEITPLIKAVLSSADQDAIGIQPDEIDDLTMVGSNRSAALKWQIESRKAGPQKMILRIYRLVKVDGRDDWRKVEEFNVDVDVDFKMSQRLQPLLDWEWIAGILITLLIIPAFWRWYDQRNKKPKQLEKSRQNKPGNESLGNIFISYRRSDSADIVGRIYDRLIDEFGRNPIFKDVDSIPFGVDFKEYLDKRVGECKVLLAVIGDRWVDANDATGKKRLEDSGDFVRLEIESALERGIPVIPLLVRGAQMPSEEHLPPSLKKLAYRNGIQIRSDPDFHNDMNRLITALEKYIR